MTDSSDNENKNRKRRTGGPIRVVAGLDIVVPEPSRAAPETASVCDRDLIETLTDWGIEPWEIALATGQDESLVDAVVGERERRSARPRAPWADDFLIFLHARLADLPNWWERIQTPAANAAESGYLPPPPPAQKKRARTTRAL